MAFVLDKNNKGKGILVLKHLEIDYYNSLNIKIIKNLRKKYIIGVYFGFHFKLKKDIKNIDFYLAEDNVIEYSNFNSLIPRCNLNGYNFINNSEFEVSNEDKITDLIYIGNSSRRKNLKSLLNALFNLEKINIYPSVIIINIYRPSVDEVIELLKIKNILNKLSNKKITYIEINNRKGKPIPKYIISKLLKSSKYLVLTSSAEGAARVVAEAILSGVGVISNGNMKGGTNNHLDENDYIYYDVKDLEKSIIKSLNNSGLVKNNNSDKFDQSNSKVILLEFFKTNFNNKLNFDVEQKILDIDLSNSFQSHNTFLNRSIPSNIKTDECLSHTSMYNLVSYLLNHEVNKYRIIILRFYDFIIKRVNFSIKIIKFVTKNIFFTS